MEGSLNSPSVGHTGSDAQQGVLFVGDVVQGALLARRPSAWTSRAADMWSSLYSISLKFQPLLSGPLPQGEPALRSVRDLGDPLPARSCDLNAVIPRAQVDPAQGGSAPL
jgi:hypothetical protein